VYSSDQLEMQAAVQDGDLLTVRFCAMLPGVGVASGYVSRYRLSALLPALYGPKLYSSNVALGVFIRCLCQKLVKIIRAVGSPLCVPYLDKLHTRLHEFASFLDRFDGRGSLLRGKPDIVGKNGCCGNHV
jgi:hypothetical protein